MDKITPHLWFDREAVEAVEFNPATYGMVDRGRYCLSWQLMPASD